MIQLRRHFYACERNQPNRSTSIILGNARLEIQRAHLEYPASAAIGSAPAVVEEHARFAVAGETYPGMIACVGASVRGLLYFDVEAQDIAALDCFEGADYRRISIDAKLDTGETVKACAYLYLQPVRLSAQAWQPERFELQRFLETYCGFDGMESSGQNS